MLAMTQNKVHDLTPAVSPKGLEGLFQEHASRIYRAAYRVTGSPNDAEDVVQTIFLRLIKRRDGLQLGPGAGSYLHRAAINAGLDLIRTRNRARAIPLDEDDEGAGYQEGHPTAQADSGAKSSELRSFLRAAMTKLSPRAAEIFSLRYFEGFGNTEIAEILGTTRESIAVTLHRSRARLKDELGALLGSIASMRPVRRASRCIAPIPPVPRPRTRSANSY